MTALSTCQLTRSFNISLYEPASDSIKTFEGRVWAENKLSDDTEQFELWSNRYDSYSTTTLRRTVAGSLFGPLPDAVTVNSPVVL